MSEVLLEAEGWRVVLTDEGIVETTMRGDLDVESLTLFFDALRGHLERLEPVLFLNDFSQVGEVSLAARWLVAQRAKENGPLIRRSAAYGLPPHWLLIGDVILRVSGRKNLSAFSTREEAVRWLLLDSGADEDSA